MKNLSLFLILLTLAVALRVSAMDVVKAGGDESRNGEENSGYADTKQNSATAADQAAKASGLEAAAGAGSGFMDDDDSSEQNAKGTPASSISQITADKYCTFLNAVAASDPHHLYDEKMSDDMEGGCILRSGSIGSYSYSVVQGKENNTIQFLSSLDTMRYCNWLENGSVTSFASSENIDGATEHGSYELQNDQLISMKQDAIYLVENNSEYDPELGSNSFEFKIINTKAASSLARASSDGSGKDTSLEEKLAGIAAGVGMIFGGGDDEHVDGNATIGPVEAKASVTAKSSPLMMFGEDEETPTKAKTDPRAINRVDARNGAICGDNTSSQISRGTTLAVAEKPTTGGSLNDEVESISSTSNDSASNFLLRANGGEFHYPLSTRFATTRGIMSPRGSSWRSAVQGVAATFGGMMMDKYLHRGDVSPQSSKLAEREYKTIQAPRFSFAIQPSVINRNGFDEKIHRDIRLALNSDQAPWNIPSLLPLEPRTQTTFSSVSIPLEGLVARHIFLPKPAEGKEGFSWNQLSTGIGEALGMNRFISYCEKGYKGGEKNDFLSPVSNKGNDQPNWNISDIIKIGSSQLNIKIGSHTFSLSYDPNTENDTSFPDIKKDKKLNPTEQTVEASQKKAEDAATRLFSNWKNKFINDGEKKLCESIVNKTNKELQIAIKAKDDAVQNLKMAEDSIQETEKKFENSAVQYNELRQAAYDECHKYITYWEQVASTVVISDELSKFNHDSYRRKIEQAKAKCTQQEWKLRKDEYDNDPSLLFTDFCNELNKIEREAIIASKIADDLKPYWVLNKFTYQEYSSKSIIAAEKWEKIIGMMEYLKARHQDDGTLNDRITKAENQKNYYRSIVKVADDNADRYP